ncbi:PREDICTED: ADP-ribosylation factor-binding protein GGA1-like, partial [Cyprinodon variegatus]|uniref:ADP-ribosylation factor-binding protein GGA1-like n=1 Tax=Cyprinodon variegatus TaxID=28743 RepID=UPI0007429C29
ELYERCDRLRPSLFRLASDTTDDDAALAQILAANDELTLVVKAYKDLMARGTCNNERSRSKSEEVTSKNICSTNRREIKSYHLIDLSALDSPQIQRKADSPPSFESSSPVFSSNLENVFSMEPDFEFDDLLTKQIQQNSKSYYEELMQIDKGCQMTNGIQNGRREILLTARGCGESSNLSDGRNV